MNLTIISKLHTKRKSKKNHQNYRNSPLIRAKKSAGKKTYGEN